ncbi:ABC1 kinase family protein [Prochlorococcus marinus]|uniref:Kinase n=1 Tax=Prochlorococcus marinus XMU1408 TaxID=2213228 RepID=A0A318RD61_PROMR|nr:AarF/ABC1/UbiB kinase family protein [Prochlorococcus marinus]MBW3041270.1 kinase [Prochlorococcus marinus str. XMU1408]PYE03858.1 kinase [Prochlorococcus marinus XMU1408]
MIFLICHFQKLRRAFRIWKTLLILFFFLWFDSRKWTYLKGYNDKRRERRQIIRAKWLTKELVYLGSAFIKLGQLLSARADVIPSAWVNELTSLQDRVPPFDFKKVEEILLFELGDSYKKIINIDSIPIGSASLAQVHKAKLINGENVIFKVQRPGIENFFRLDLDVMNQVAAVVEKNKSISQGKDWTGIAKECKRVLIRELDFKIEAQYAARFKQQFIEDSEILVPSVFWDLSSSKVLCLEYMPGIKINDIKTLKINGIDTSSIAKIGATSYLKQLVNYGFFHADPHPGNLAVSSSGSLIYYDFGMMGFVSERIRGRLNSMIKAAALRDVSGLVKELQIAGLLEADIEIGPVRRLIRVMLTEALTPPFNSKIIEKLSGDISELAYGKPFRIPIELIFVFRALSTFEGVGRYLDPEFNLIAIAKPFLLPLMTSKDSEQNDLLNELGRQVTEMGSKAVGLPKRLDENLERLEQGDLQLQVRMGESDRQLRRMINAQQTLGNSVLLGSLAISSALLASTNKPSLFFIPIILGFPIALSWIKLQFKMRSESRLDNFQGRKKL